MAAIFSDGILKIVFWKEKDGIWIEYLLKFVPRGSVNIKPILFQIIAWYQTSDKLLFEHMVAYFPDTYESLGFIELIPKAVL